MLRKLILRLFSHETVKEFAFNLFSHCTMHIFCSQRWIVELCGDELQLWHLGTNEEVSSKFIQAIKKAIKFMATGHRKVPRAIIVANNAPKYQNKISKAMKNKPKLGAVSKRLRTRHFSKRVFKQRIRIEIWLVKLSSNFCMEMHNTFA